MPAPLGSSAAVVHAPRAPRGWVAGGGGGRGGGWARAAADGPRWRGGGSMRRGAATYASSDEDDAAGGGGDGRRGSGGAAQGPVAVGAGGGGVGSRGTAMHPEDDPNVLHPVQYCFAQAFGCGGTNNSGASRMVSDAMVGAEAAAAVPVGADGTDSLGEGDGEGGPTVYEADIISAVRFNETGEVVATGDKGGRIVVLRRVDGGSRVTRRPRHPLKRPAHLPRSGRRSGTDSTTGGGYDESDASDASTSDGDDAVNDDDPAGGGGGGAANGHVASASVMSLERGTGRVPKARRHERPARRPCGPSFGWEPHPPELRFWTQFQSHEPEFDYLKSMEIEEKVNQIRWFPQLAADAFRLVATNDKTIKLWRVAETDCKELISLSHVSRAPLSPMATRGFANRRASPSQQCAPQRPAGSGAAWQPTAVNGVLPSSTQWQMDPAAAGGLGGGSNGARPGDCEHMVVEEASSSGSLVDLLTDTSLREDARLPPAAPDGSPQNGNVQQHLNPYLELPQMVLRGRRITATPRRVFSNVHAYHINSISVNSDGETFLSADDLRVNLWNVQTGGCGFTVLDIKPTKMEDLTEVITAVEFHPRHCHLFAHSSSRGVVKLCDLRESATCHRAARSFEEPSSSSALRQSFFSEIIASVSDVKFSPDCDGRFLLARDYMHLRLWDVRQERTPVLEVGVHEHLHDRLSALYDKDCIFDKYTCAFSCDGRSMLTGSYNGLYQSYSSIDGSGAAIEASVDFVSGASGRHRFSAQSLAADLIAGATTEELVDPTRRIMYVHASPVSQVSAVSAGPALYVFHA